MKFATADVLNAEPVRLIVVGVTSSLFSQSSSGRARETWSMIWTGPR